MKLSRKPKRTHFNLWFQYDTFCARFSLITHALNQIGPGSGLGCAHPRLADTNVALFSWPRDLPYFESLFLFIFFQYQSTTLESVVQKFDLGEHGLREYGLESSTSEWRSERFWVYSGSRPRDAASRAGLRAVAWHREACDIGVVSEWLLGQNGTLRAYFKRGQT